jgi:tetratricopeptide (TPR) repeat protein
VHIFGGLAGFVTIILVLGMGFASLFLHAAAGSAKVANATYGRAFFITTVTAGLRIAIGMALLTGLFTNSLFYLMHMAAIGMASTILCFVASLALIKAIYKIDWEKALKVWVFWGVAVVAGGALFQTIQLGMGGQLSMSFDSISQILAGGFSTRHAPRLTGGSSKFLDELTANQAALTAGETAMTEKNYVEAKKHFLAALDISRKSTSMKELSVVPVLGKLLGVQTLLHESVKSTTDELDSIPDEYSVVLAPAWVEGYAAAMDINDEALAKTYYETGLKAASKGLASKLSDFHSKVGKALMARNRTAEALPHIEHVYLYRKKALSDPPGIIDMTELNKTVLKMQGAEYAAALRQANQAAKAQEITDESTRLSN